MINRFGTASPTVRAHNKRDAIVFCITAPRKGIYEIRSTVARRLPVLRAHSRAGVRVHTYAVYARTYLSYTLRLYEILFNANTVVNDNGGVRPPIDLNNASSRLPRPSVQQYQLQFLYPPPPPSRAELRLFTGNGYFLLFHFPPFYIFYCSRVSE